MISHQNQVDELFLSSVLECVKSSYDKNELKNALFSLISALNATKNIAKNANASKVDFQSINKAEKIFALLGEIFAAFRDKIYAIYARGDILDCSFLYLSFITPDFLAEIFEGILGFEGFGRNADFAAGDLGSRDFARFEGCADFDSLVAKYFSNDERFLHFIEIADKMLAPNATNTTSATNTSYEEWIMLVELGSICRVLAFPTAQYRAKSHKNTAKTSKIQNDNAKSPNKKTAKHTHKNKSQNDTQGISDTQNALVFFTAFVALSDMQCAPAQKIQPFIYEAYALFGLDFSLLEEAIILAFAKADNPLKRRNVCNWQLHIFWNVAHWFNSREWLNLYALWREVFYERIAWARGLMDFDLQKSRKDISKRACQSAPQIATQVATQTACQNISSHKNDLQPSKSNLQPLYQAIDEVLYLQLFIYHFCGNSFVSQEQWRDFNNEVLQKSTALYREFGEKFLAKSSKMDFAKSSPKSTKSTAKSPPKSSKKIIGFLRDRFVENSPFKVEYSLIKNLMDSAEFREKYSIKIYCMSLIEKSENDPRIMQLFAKIGVEIIDIGIGFNRANFYNSHLQKALALREIMLSDKVEVLISPNNGYGISDFLLSVRCAPMQVFWTHGNFVYDIEGIDDRLTHICNDLREIAHEGVRFGGIPVKMDNGFYNPPVLDEEIAQARENIAHLLAQNLPKSSTHLSAKSSQKFESKSALDFGGDERDGRKISKTDKAGNEEKERDKDFGVEILQDKVILGVMGRLTKIDSLEYLGVICEILERKKECIFVACGAGNEEVIKEKILQINPSVLSRFCFTGQIDSAVYGHIIDVWCDSFPMEQGESRIEYVAKGRGIALRLYASDEGEFLGGLERGLDALSGVIDEILREGDLSPNHIKMDFTGYKNMVLGFGQNRAFCKDEYLQKALKLIDSTSKKDKNFQNALHTQSLIFEMGNVIKERLGVRYFMEFLDSHICFL